MRYEEVGSVYALVGMDQTSMFSAKPTPESIGPLEATQEDMLAQIEAKIGKGNVLDVFRAVDRVEFVPDPYKKYAYVKAGIPLTETAGMSFPTMVARSTDLLGLKWSDRVLEVGAGSGYGAAILSRLAHEVHTIDIDPRLVDYSRARLEALGFSNVDVHLGDGRNGILREAPFDAILVTAGSPEVPPKLLDQLAPGGRMVIPIGEAGKGQKLARFTKNSEGVVAEESHGDVFFSPLQSQPPHILR